MMKIDKKAKSDQLPLSFIIKYVIKRCFFSPVILVLLEEFNIQRLHMKICIIYCQLLTLFTLFIFEARKMHKIEFFQSVIKTSCFSMFQNIARNILLHDCPPETQ